MSKPTDQSNDFGWKLLSIVLATLIWLVIHFTIQGDLHQEPSPGFVASSREFSHLPITIMTTASDSAGFNVEPREVNIVVSGSARALSNLTSTDVEVFVNLVDVAGAKALRKRISVHVPAGVTVTRVEPSEVNVEAAAQAGVK